MLAPPRMETPREPTPEQSYTDGRAVSGKMFVIIFVAIAVLLAGSVTMMRVNVRPAYQAAVASSSAKAVEEDAKRAAAAASAKPQEPQK